MLTSACGAAWLSALVLSPTTSAMAIGAPPNRAAPAINPQATIRIRNLLLLV
jgi:hypothetical protein